MKNQQVNVKLLPPRLLFIIVVICLVAMAISIYLEFRSQQKDYLELMNKQAELFINTLASATQNALSVAEQVEELLNRHILSNLKIIEQLDELKSKDALFSELLGSSRVEALQWYNKSGKLVQQAGRDLSQQFIVPMSLLRSRLNNTYPDTVVSVFEVTNSYDERLVALVSRRSGGILAAFVSQEEIRSLRSLLGIGYFLKRFQSEKHIEYIVIQNSETIIAGSFDGYRISTYSEDPTLAQAEMQDQNQSRILDYEDKAVFETISTFIYDGIPVGIVRLGLSMEEYQRLQKDVYKRLAIFVAVFVVFGIIFIHFLMVHQQRRGLLRNLDRLHEYTNTILDNLQSGVISIDQKGSIQTINKQALTLLGKSHEDIFLQSANVLPDSFKEIIRECKRSEQQKFVIVKDWITGSDNQRKVMSIQCSEVEDETGDKMQTLLFDDITDQTRLEEQIRRNQRLTAMKNLASTVAHEIKNPLNAIKLNIDLIRKKFKPQNDAEMYSRNMKTVQAELDRINHIVEQYLRYTRSPEIHIKSLDLEGLIDELSALFTSHFKERRIIFNVELSDPPEIQGDKDQLKQALINVIKNAEESIEVSGEINLVGRKKSDFYEIEISDSGRGISEKEIQSVFDFHFTTKSDGSGIGLTVVQQIIEAHRGVVDIHSEVGRGTTVFLRLPL